VQRLLLYCLSSLPASPIGALSFDPASTTVSFIDWSTHRHLSPLANPTARPALCQRSHLRVMGFESAQTAKMPPRSNLTTSFPTTDANNEVVCPLRNQDGSSCRKRCIGVSDCLPILRYQCLDIAVATRFRLCTAVRSATSQMHEWRG
jgi:hypothetical protein